MGVLGGHLSRERPRHVEAQQCYMKADMGQQVCVHVHVCAYVCVCVCVCVCVFVLCQPKLRQTMSAAADASHSVRSCP